MNRIVNGILLLLAFMTHIHGQNLAQADTTVCVPPCRTGYLCHEGKCISLCNPPCQESMVCNGKGECEETGSTPSAIPEILAISVVKDRAALVQGFVIMTSDSTEILINEKSYGQKETLFVNVPYGDYEIEANRNGYMPNSDGNDIENPGEIKEVFLMPSLFRMETVFHFAFAPVPGQAVFQYLNIEIGIRSLRHSITAVAMVGSSAGALGGGSIGGGGIAYRFLGLKVHSTSFVPGLKFGLWNNGEELFPSLFPILAIRFGRNRFTAFVEAFGMIGPKAAAFGESFGFSLSLF